jgi:hypothetical protein
MAMMTARPRRLTQAVIAATLLVTALPAFQALGMAPAAADPAGTASNLGLGIDAPVGIVAGPDGNLWFTNTALNTIGLITTSGAVSSFGAPGVFRRRGTGPRRTVLRSPG